MGFDEPWYSKPGFNRATGAKRRRESVSVEEAKNTIRAILALEEGDLRDPAKSTQLPYLGVGRPCTRPEPDVNFVGKFAVFELIFDWEDNVVQNLIYGPKGVGKSTDFRAVACILYQWFAKDDGSAKERLVFLAAELLLLDVVAAVGNALFFTFLLDEITGYGNWQEVQRVVASIDSIDKAVAFVEERKENQAKSEKFYFFVDGGEQLDAMDFYGRPTYNSQNRSAVANTLNRLLVTGARVWWCASPRAQMSAPESLPLNSFHYSDRGFSKAEYETYASNSFLAQLPDARLSSIEYFTGFVPLFLEALCACCEEFARGMLEPERQAVLASGQSFRSQVVALRALQPTNEQIALLLEEDDNWDAVTRRFCSHGEIKLVRKKAQEIVLQGECDTDASMAKLDPTYVLDMETGRYCSSYIKRLYMEQVFSKKEQVKPYADGAWMEYARRLLHNESINWSTLGHLCEDVLASVIQRKGLILGSLTILGSCITLQQFDSTPSRSIRSLLELKPNSGYYFKPMDVNFPHVDAVIVWVDEKGSVYIVPIQFTVNVDDHLKSADQFMNLLSLKQWFPDILTYLSGTSSSSGSTSRAVELHYVFLGCSARPGYSSGVQQAKLRKPRSGQTSGIPQYVLHIQAFNNRCLPGLHADDYKVLLQIASRRSWKKSYSHVRPDGLGLLALTRSKLERLAKEEFGIADPSPSMFKDKGLLINKMLEVKPELDAGLDVQQ